LCAKKTTPAIAASARALRFKSCDSNKKKGIAKSPHRVSPPTSGKMMDHQKSKTPQRQAEFIPPIIRRKLPTQDPRFPGIGRSLVSNRWPYPESPAAEPSKLPLGGNTPDGGEQ
jgi:hypothetical protein